MNGQTDMIYKRFRRMDERTDRWMDGWMDEWTDG